MLLTTLFACSGSAPWASVSVDRDAPVVLDRRLNAYFVETTATRSGEGEGLLVLLPDDVGCTEVTTASRIDFDEDHPLFNWEGLVFFLSYDSGDGATELGWEDLYWGNDATSAVGYRSMTAWLMTGSSLLGLDGGWLEMTEHSNELVAGSFDVRWYAGDFEAEHCGVSVTGDGGVDTGR